MNSRGMVRVIWYLVSLVTALLSLFFIFYTARLLYVTHWLTATRTGGNGAYIGAVVFPLLAVLFGAIAWRCIRSGGRA